METKRSRKERDSSNEFEGRVEVSYDVKVVYEFCMSIGNSPDAVVDVVEIFSKPCLALKCNLWRYSQTNKDRRVVLLFQLPHVITFHAFEKFYCP